MAMLYLVVTVASSTFVTPSILPATSTASIIAATIIPSSSTTMSCFFNHLGIDTFRILRIITGISNCSIARCIFCRCHRRCQGTACNSENNEHS
ncbi:uncharacterized protein BYT42DRAFT_566197 [Radiomyces spectabilis]|uniref:uncharacterized protein n=1 Tax=Radiomyces spectabilis TaxID=64574 RepID=UPI00221F7B6E|nr:uncharacterized protein BYT42DRAFT_566197 [Radiomyces spectabilis]KAI8381345.1 hypothetical protein BYT42DRAFT_566197 [Radiomyces spectabilis]